MAKEIESIYKNIGSKIQELREAKGLTQVTLGQLLDPSATRASVANIENGKQRVLLHTLLQIANILSVGYEELIPVSKHESPSLFAKAIKRELKQKFKSHPSQLKKIENIIKTTENAA